MLVVEQQVFQETASIVDVIVASIQPSPRVNELAIVRGDKKNTVRIVIEDRVREKLKQVSLGAKTAAFAILWKTRQISNNMNSRFLTGNFGVDMEIDSVGLPVFVASAKLVPNDTAKMGFSIPSRSRKND
ncbi:hypothetical protein [Mariniblastus fucicola]|uniref:hypothetical protein n=1 Tax=Mariniblastus fucicola TaxID=980251 RepID=UPI0011E0673F|nr:hypothetical protein [Mariniblastus fucicola]